MVTKITFVRTNGTLVLKLAGGHGSEARRRNSVPSNSTTASNFTNSMFRETLNITRLSEDYSTTHSKVRAAFITLVIFISSSSYALFIYAAALQVRRKTKQLPMCVSCDCNKLDPWG